jgi:hypothetical protein
VNRSSGYPFNNSHIQGSVRKAPNVYFGDTPPAAATADYLRNYQQQLVDSTCVLAKDRPVYLVRPFPEMLVSVPSATSRQLLLGKTPSIGI